MTRAQSKARRRARALGGWFLGACIGLLLAPVSYAGPEVSGSRSSEAELNSKFEAVGEETGAFGLPKRVRHLETGIVLVLIPADRVTLGSPDSEPQRSKNEALRSAVISSPYYLAETEVTVGQWLAVMDELPRHAIPGAGEDLPITGVSWYAARDFADRLNSGSDSAWRLPTEAEWEHACRAGTSTPFSFGSSVSTHQVNFDGKRPYDKARRGARRDGPVAVRSFPANAWGLYEMHGNVFEWCEDLYQPRPERGAAAKQFEGASRVLRGGAWSSWAKKTRSAYRDGYAPSSADAKYGFRTALSMSGVLK